MFTLIFLYFLLNIQLLVASFMYPRCFWRMKQSEDKDGDLVTDCVFSLGAIQWPVEKEYFYHILNTEKPTKNLQFALALAFSLDEVNRNPSLLPNISLIFHYPVGGCKSMSRIINIIRLFVQNYDIVPNYICNKEVKCAVILTGPKWETSAILQTYLDLFLYQQVLQITYGSFHHILSDHEQFPNLYQMAPEDTSVVFAIVSFILHFSWNWVGLVISDNDQGVQFLTYLKREMEKNTICFAFVNMIPVNMEIYMSRAEVYYNQIMTSSTNVVIIYGDTDSTLAVSLRMWESLGIQKIWVTTSEWDVTRSKRDLMPNSFHGALLFTHHHPDISGLKNFVQTFDPLKYTVEYLARLEWMNFNCEASASNCKTMKNCSSNASMEWLMAQTFDMAFSDGSYDIYNAVYAMAHVLHEMTLQKIDNMDTDNGNGLNSHCLKTQSFLRKSHFTNPVGDRVNMNEKQKLLEVYTIFYTWDLSNGVGVKVKIGQFSPFFPHGKQLHLSEDMMEWATGSSKMPPCVCSADCGPGFRKFWQEGMASCCFDCSPCPENEISNETNMGDCVMCPENQYANIEQNKCLNKAVVFLSYEDTLGMAFALTSLCFSIFTVVVFVIFVKHHDTPIVKANNRTLSYLLLMSLMSCFLCSLLFIGRPNSATCILQQITFGIVFTVAISTVLAKTITVVLAFKVTVPRRRMRNILVSGVPNYIIPISSLLQGILCAIWIGTSPPFVNIDAHSENNHIIIVCNKGSVTGFYCVLGYLACLALGSFTVAFLARNLPDTFNEAKYLTFSMLVFCSVWVTFLPVYHSTKGMVMVVVEIFSILVSSAGMLGCIFLPKFYIILLRPDRNSIQKIRERSSL